MLAHCLAFHEPATGDSMLMRVGGRETIGEGRNGEAFGETDTTDGQDGHENRRSAEGPGGDGPGHRRPERRIGE